ncbi:unnamed protein product [Sphagnum balticum]
MVWIVDYNRQNLDGTRISNEKALKGTDADRIVRIAEANGWTGVKLKHGKKREAWFAKPGGEEFQRVIDEEFSDFEFQALLSANKPELTRQVLEKKSATLKKWLEPFQTRRFTKFSSIWAGMIWRNSSRSSRKPKQAVTGPPLSLRIR